MLIVINIINKENWETPIFVILDSFGYLLLPIPQNIFNLQLLTNLNLFGKPWSKNTSSTTAKRRDLFDPLPQSLQILVHGHLFHVINVLHLIIGRAQIIREAVIAAGHVHHRSSVARHNLTVRADVLHFRERGNMVGFVAAPLASLHLPVTIVYTRIQIIPEIGHSEDVLPSLNLPVQTRLPAQFRGYLRLELRADARVHPHVAVRRPEFRAQANFVHRSVIRLHRHAEIRPDVGPVRGVVGILKVWLSILDQYRHVDLLQRLALHCVLRLEALHALQPRPFVLVSPVLEPDLHLGAGQFQGLGE